MKQQHIILVHGAGHGAWCWYKVAPLLKSAGHRVTIPDLSASGINLRKMDEVATFLEYSNPLLEILASLPPKEKVILVGHSLGGINIALAADMFPEKIAALVHVAALMPDCEHDPSYVTKEFQHTRETVWFDTQFSFVGATEENRRLNMLFGPQFLAKKLYQLCPQEDLMLANNLVRPACLFVEDLVTKPAFSMEKYGSVHCFYIMCPEDVLIVKEYQQQMIQNLNVNINVVEITGADHMPMFSKPEELGQCLLQIADGI